MYSCTSVCFTPLGVCGPKIFPRQIYLSIVVNIKTMIMNMSDDFSIFYVHSKKSEIMEMRAYTLWYLPEERRKGSVPCWIVLGQEILSIILNIQPTLIRMSDHDQPSCFSVKQIHVKGNYKFTMVSLYFTISMLSSRWSKRILNAGRVGTPS